MKKEKLTEDFIENRGRSLFATSRNWIAETVVPRWKDSNDLYNSKFKKQNEGKSDILIGQGKLFIPKTYSHVQRMLVDILDTYFLDPEEIVDVISWKSIPSETREIVKALMNYRLNGHPINFYQESYEACLDALKNKVGIFKVYPNIKTEKTKVQIPNPANPLETIEEEKEVVTSFNPCIDCLPYEDVFFSPNATWKDYWRFPIIHRMRKPLDYLKRRGYKNLEDLESVYNSEGVDEIKEQRTADMGSPFSNNQDVSVNGQNEIFIYEFWDFLDVNGDGLLESCSYIMAGTADTATRLIRDIEENTLPYMAHGDDYNRPPIVMGQSFPEPHQLMGKDLPEIVEGLQRETNAIRNQRREAVALALRKPILINRSANIDLVGLLNRRIGGIVQGDDISLSSVREMDISDPTSQSIAEMAKVDTDFYETTSVPPNLLGMPSSSDETATAVTSQVANANKKIANVIRNLAYTLFIPSLRMLLRLEQMYESDNYIQMVTGRILGWKMAMDNMPPIEIIQGDFDLTVNIGMNKQTQINKWIMLFDRGVQANQATVGMLQAGVVNPANVHFVDTMKFYHKMLPLVGEKAVKEYMIAAQAAPQEGMASGVASQPRLPEQLTGEVGSMNPEGMQGMVNV